MSASDLLQTLSFSPGRWVLTGAYLGVLGLITIYGLHRYWLMAGFFRHRRQSPRPLARFDELPRITVQLPMFNESNVARRIIDAACRLEYPPQKLQIQVLDDSTDQTADIARGRVRWWAARGTDISYCRRAGRTGYKAGALAAALPQASGDLIAIFDADFVPPGNFLKRTVHYFTDQGVGMVQVRWGHLNRNDSLLTRCQAIFLDGHFVIEHAARNRCGRWFNFNGTAGVWRRRAIQDAGGWDHDTLTEDLDLSYRAQMAGWRFVYLTRVCCPAELPPEINAFKSQQHRWTKGSIQTALKLLPRLLRSGAPPGIKIEALFHLTSPLVYLYVTLLALLFYPAIAVNLRPFGSQGVGSMLLGLSLFALGTTSAGVFYVASQKVQKRSAFWTMLQLPILMSIGIGIAINNARGCVEALLGHQSPFVRTPKYNTDRAPGGRSGSKGPVIPISSIKIWMILLEIAMGLYMLLCALRGLHGPTASVVSIPFLLLFASGYFYVGLASLWSHVVSRGRRGEGCFKSRPILDEAGPGSSEAASAIPSRWRNTFPRCAGPPFGAQGSRPVPPRPRRRPDRRR